MKLWSKETTLTINLNTEEGKYFLKKLIPRIKHVMGMCPNEDLGEDWCDYSMHDEDYRMCCDKLKKIREES